MTCSASWRGSLHNHFHQTVAHHLRRFLIIVLLTRPWGLLFASALGGASFSIPWWGMALIGVGGLRLFILGMKYGDRVEESILHRLGR